MKRAKSLKILLLSLVFAVSVIFGFSLMNLSTGVATSSNSKYFKYVESEHTVSDIVLEDSLVNIPMKNGDIVEVENKLIVDDFGIKFSVPQNAKSIKLVVKTDAYYVTGNKKVGLESTTYEKQVENYLLLTNESGNLVAEYNGGSKVTIGAYSADMFAIVNLKLEDNFLKATVNGTSVSASSEIYYKVKNIDKVIASVGFEVETEESFTEDVTLKVEYIDQKVAVATGEYKQTFALTEGAIATEAYPRLTLSEGFFAGKKLAGFDNAVKDGEVYTVTPTVYSVTGFYKTSNTKLIEETANADNIWIGNVSSSSKKLSFNKTESVDEMSVSFVAEADENKVFETYKVKVIGKAEDNKAPEYINDADALESFNEALKKSLKTEYDVNGTKEEHFIRIGEGKYLEIPSMFNLVQDDLCSYDNLSYTVNYKNLTESSSYASSMKVPVKYAGKYSFYVVFADKSSNAMNADDFYKTADDDVTPEYGKYEDYIFSFEISDDAPMTITKASSQGEGFKGVQYTATAFTITASAYTVSYKLYYSSSVIDVDADGWKQILSTSDVNSGLTSQDFTTEQLNNFAYNGSLTFTPTELGYYKIVCEVNSSNSERSISDAVVINVQSEPKVVKPDNKWLENNVWSVVFLSVGSVCLIAIIVLLFIKPKKETVEGEPEKKVKVKRQKKSKK